MAIILLADVTQTWLMQGLVDCVALAGEIDAVLAK